MEDNGDIVVAVNGVSNSVRRKNGATKRTVRTIISIITPLLLKSADPRIVALGLALQASAQIFLAPKRQSKIGVR